MNKPIASPTDPTQLSRPIFLILFVIATTSALALISVGTSLGSLQSWLKTTSAEAPIWAAPILFVIISIVLMSIIVPKTMVSVTAGALFGTQLGGLLVAIIALSAAVLNYGIGRWCIARMFNRTLDTTGDLQKTGTRANWAKALRDLASEGGLGFHLLFRFAPIPSMLVNYSMGAANARMMPYTIAAAIGVLPQLLWVHGGTIATMDLAVNQTSPIGAWRPITAGVSILAAIAISIVIPRQVMRRIDAMD